jgi:DNA-binding transcriptional ArsR family regulator
MRKLFHPPLKEITVDQILFALSDPIRARIFQDIASASCPQRCSEFLSCGGQKIPKSSLSSHFKILRQAGLIRSEKIGVELRNVSRCAELRQRFGGLIEAILRAYAAGKPRQPRRSDDS